MELCHLIINQINNLHLQGTPHRPGAEIDFVLYYGCSKRVHLCTVNVRICMETSFDMIYFQVTEVILSSFTLILSPFHSRYYNIL